MASKKETTGTTHTCGQCTTSFETMTDLDEHLAECDTYECGVCGFGTADLREWLDHRPCSAASPVSDPEGEWRDERREESRQERWDRSHPEGAY